MNFKTLLVLIFSVVVLYQILKFKKLKKKLKEIRTNWGKIQEHALNDNSVRIFFDLNKANSIDHSHCLDEDTWYDLDFDEIFKLINRTITPVGAQNLYYLLRHPVFNKEILEKREKLIKSFSDNSPLREKVQLILQRLNDKNVKYLPYSLYQTIPEKPAYAKILPFLSFISLLVLLLVLFHFLHISVLIALFFMNFVIHFLVKRRIEAFVYSFQYLGVLISTAKKLSSLKFSELKELQQILTTNLKKTKRIAQKIFTLQFKDELGLIEYINIYFLWDVAGFYSAIDKINRHIKELREIFEIIGYLDALISIASFRLNYSHFCHPFFEKDKYIIKNIYNPLLENPVDNSFDFKDKNVIITGSNMAGKTTFLKTIGVNAIFAQTINTVMAEQYTSPFISVISSIERKDDLVSGKSYYLAEVESILRLIKVSESEIIHLFILDEIFRGTNSVERFAASVAVLNHLANDKDYILVATHDLQLTEILNYKYKNYHFQDQVSDKGLLFDYKLHTGKASTTNAIALLKHVGYPKSIVENAIKFINKESL